MHITLLCLGSRGDVFPYVALGAGLRDAGAEVRIITSENFQSLVEAHSLEFHPIQIDSQAILETSAGRSLAASGNNIVRAASAAFKSFGVLADQYVADLSSPDLLDTDAILNQLPGSVFGFDLAEKQGIPYFVGSVIPMTPTNAFPMIGLQSNLQRIPGYNALTYVVAEQVLWQFYRKATNRWRREVLGLQSASFWGHYKKMRAVKVPILNGFSEHVVPRPSDWGSNVHVTGYWFGQQSQKELPGDLQSFIDAGTPPVFVGFGSMPIDRPKRSMGIVAEALRRIGARGVVSSGWGGLSQKDFPAHLFQIDYAPFSQLFPQMAAVVHHGGSGTAAAGLRAGVPCVLVPFVFDQFYWGDRLHELGVSPRPIPHKELRVGRLTSALDQALKDDTMRQRAAELGTKIRAEDGVQAAVEKIFHHMH
jgi:UDP:flavonoid glycosyltransferase YjiC (YdhE family)